jgi:hypothetical protein
MIDCGLSAGPTLTESPDSYATSPSVPPPLAPQELLRQVQEMLGGVDEIAMLQGEASGAGPLTAH